jgi:hypothetical protein
VSTKEWDCRFQVHLPEVHIEQMWKSKRCDESDPEENYVVLYTDTDRYSTVLTLEIEKM